MEGWGKGGGRAVRALLPPPPPPAPFAARHGGAPRQLHRRTGLWRGRLRGARLRAPQHGRPHLRLVHPRAVLRARRLGVGRRPLARRREPRARRPPRAGVCKRLRPLGEPRRGRDVDCSRHALPRHLSQRLQGPLRSDALADALPKPDALRHAVGQRHGHPQRHGDRLHHALSERDADAEPDAVAVSERRCDGEPDRHCVAHDDGLWHAVSNHVAVAEPVAHALAHGLGRAVCLADSHGVGLWDAEPDAVAVCERRGDALSDAEPDAEPDGLGLSRAGPPRQLGRRGGQSFVCGAAHRRLVDVARRVLLPPGERHGVRPRQVRPAIRHGRPRARRRRLADARPPPLPRDPRHGRAHWELHAARLCQRRPPHGSAELRDDLPRRPGAALALERGRAALVLPRHVCPEPQQCRLGRPC